MLPNRRNKDAPTRVSVGVHQTDRAAVGRLARECNVHDAPREHDGVLHMRRPRVHPVSLRRWVRGHQHVGLACNGGTIRAVAHTRVSRRYVRVGAGAAALTNGLQLVHRVEMFKYGSFDVRSGSILGNGLHLYASPCALLYSTILSMLIPVDTLRLSAQTKEGSRKLTSQ